MKKAIVTISWMFLLYIAIKVVVKLILQDDILDYKIYVPALTEALLFSIIFHFTISPFRK
jgi:hypothetical protein